MLDAVLEQRAVGEPGQVVVERLHHEPLLELATHRDVGQRPGHPAEPPGIVVDRPGVGLDPDVCPVASDEPELVPVLVQLALDDGPRQVGVALPVVGVDEVDDRSADGVGHRVTGELFPGVVEERPAALAVDAEDDLADGFDDRPIARLAVAQRVARGLCVGHRLLQAAAVPVQDERDQPDDRRERERRAAPPRSREADPDWPA